MPESYARIANRMFENQVIALPFDMPTMDAWLYWHASAETEPANRWLREQLIQSFQKP